MALTPIIITTANPTTTTAITVSAYNDGNISFSGFSLVNPKAILTACRKILKLAGIKARPYPVKVFRGTTLLFKVRSVRFGSLRTQDGFDADFEILDNQYLDRLEGHL